LVVLFKVEEGGKVGQDHQRKNPARKKAQINSTNLNKDLTKGQGRKKPGCPWWGGNVTSIQGEVITE